jgi:hypothetical protein
VSGLANWGVKGDSAEKFSHFSCLNQDSLDFQDFFVGTGLQPVLQCFGNRVAMKHCGRGCKPRPAPEMTEIYKYNKINDLMII